MNNLLNSHTKKHKLVNTSKALTEVLSFRKDDEVGVRRRLGEIYGRGKLKKIPIYPLISHYSAFCT